MASQKKQQTKVAPVLEESVAANWAKLTKGQSVEAAATSTAPKTKTKPSTAQNTTRGKGTAAKETATVSATKKRKASTTTTTKAAEEPSKPPTKRPKKDTATTAKKTTSKETGALGNDNNKPTPAKKAATKKASPRKKATAETKEKKPRKPRKSRAKKKQEAIVVPVPAPAKPPPPPPPKPKEPWVDPFPIAQNLLQQVEFAMFSIQPELDTTRELLEKYHEPTRLAKQLQQEQALQNGSNNNGGGGGSTGTATINASILADPISTTTTTTTNTSVDDTTAGHSNTNHQVVLTGDPMLDRLREYQRNYAQRQRVLVPEQKGNDRWDKPRLPGQRRRRIHREVDRPEAPPAPPPQGYTVFVGQMTTKIRHDRPNQHHSQAKVMQEIAKMWKDDMSDLDRLYYITFCDLAKAEYVQQQMEFRASGTYTKSHLFVRLGESGHGPWIHMEPSQRNALEQELSTYETVDFPLRPASMDEEYQWRDWRSKVNRRMKLKKLIVDYTDAIEQQIVADAVNHAKAEWMDEPGLALSDVDHTAILAAASQECIVKLTALKEAKYKAECPLQGDHEEEEEEEEDDEVEDAKGNDEVKDEIVTKEIDDDKIIVDDETLFI